MVYVPAVAAEVAIGELAPAPQLEGKNTLFPAGFFNEMTHAETGEYVLLLMLIFKLCPAAAVNVNAAFCPTAVFPADGTRAAAPLIVSVPVKSAGTLFSVSVSLPMFVLLCFIQSA
jgi:hypothetical protein